MNIRQAKEEIKHTIGAYLKKDETGAYKIPVRRQRPLLLIGPPGVGKTQIMEQTARECGIGLVSYTITHHTRQSAIGLPFIKEREFQGKTYAVTEYTMSEIVASVYQKIEETGRKEGILFIDEINCVSETLAPTMLQFLQCKQFGNQQIPAGWLIVAAGNPPEYNRSVKEFDMVTLDRVRTITVEADKKVWMEYAKEQNLHGALLSYLELRPKNFYRIEADVDGMQYVTARGWEDFSYLLYAYEEEDLPVTEEIVYEYLHHKEVAEDVAAYIDLYRKYQDDYGIDKILAGQVKPAVFARIEQAGFDERLSVVNLLLDGLMGYLKAADEEKQLTDEYFAFLQSYRKALETCDDPAAEYQKREDQMRQEAKEKEQAGLFDKAEIKKIHKLFSLLKEGEVSSQTATKEDAFEEARIPFERCRMELEQTETEAGKALEYAFDFMEDAFGKSEEMVVFVTELSVNKAAVGFLAEHGCKRYFTYNMELMIGSRKSEIMSELKR